MLDRLCAVIAAIVTALLLLAAPASAQRAAVYIGTSATSASTITITPPAADLHVFVTNVEIQNCAGGTAVTAAAPTTVTTTNLNGAAWMVGSGVTAGVCQPAPITPLITTLRSAVAGTNVTIVLPTFATNQTIRVSVYYYFGPAL